MKLRGQEQKAWGTGLEENIKLHLAYPFGLQVSFPQGLSEAHRVSEVVSNTREVLRLLKAYRAEFQSWRLFYNQPTILFQGDL